MNNNNPSHSFNSLRKSPKRKKMKIEYESNISFWDNVKDSNCEEETRSESEFTEFSFTSFEIEHSKKSSKHITSIKFIIREIEREEDCVRLISNDVVCTVFGEWTELDYEIDTKITVTPCICCTHELARDFIDSKIHIRVDDNTNYLFIEDDLMTITNLCSSIRCYNRPMVNSKVADINFEFRDKCLVNGIILHDVMEEVLINKNYTLAFIKEAVRKATENNALNIYACNTTEISVKNDIFTSLTNISRFKRHNLVFEQSEKRIVSLISNLKGNIDVVGENIVLEIKSGKSMDVSHKAQVILYNLLIKERFFRDFDCYLYYIANDNLVKIDVKHSEVKSLFIRRNKLTLKNDIEICNCQAFEPCQIINKILSLPSDHFLKQTWDAIEKEENYRLKETWNSVTIKKQSDTNVIFKFDFDPSIIDDIYINIYNQDLIKLCKGIITSFENNIMMVSLSERINLENNSQYFISFGCNDLFFKYLRYSLINIAFFRYVDSSNGHGFKLPGEEFQLGNESDIEDFNSSADSLDCDSLEFNDKSINKSNIEITNQLDDVFMKTIETTPIKNTHIASIRNVSSSLDLNTALLKNSASSLDSSFQYFTPPTPPKVTYKYQIPEIYKDQFFSLNEEQKNSLFLSLNCENYKIIHGMPGTGKSTIIVLLIKILISLNFKVLLVCYTNLAITNILDKLKTVRYYRARKEKIEFKSSEEVKKYYDNIDLVASTCFGFSDTIFIDRKFDFCIIDEGSQQHLLLTLIPVSLSNRFVIFGDHLQLKPLVKSCKFLSTSLFEYLLDEDHSELHTQYRMGRNIMRLSNELFYGNRLIAANDFKDKVLFIDSTDINYSEFIINVKNSTILCYFNSQVKLTKLHTKCQVETIDRFQGSEDENVIIVFDPVSSCEVMESHERLNVALTRARRSLTLVGDKEKMMEVDILRRFLEIL